MKFSNQRLIFHVTYVIYFAVIAVTASYLFIYFVCVFYFLLIYPCHGLRSRHYNYVESLFFLNFD